MNPHLSRLLEPPQFGPAASLVWNQFWQVTLVVLVVAVVVRLFCRRRPHLAYLLWLLVIVKCLTPPIFASPTGLFSWATVRMIPSAASSARSSESDHGPPVPLPAPEGVTVVPETPPPAASSRAPTIAGADAVPTSRPVRVTTVLGITWLCGAVAYAGIVIGMRIRWSLTLHHSRVAPDAALKPLFAELSKRLGIKRRVRLLVTSKPLGPVVYGWFRPTLLLPELLWAEKSQQTVKTILAHELMHVRRHDMAVGVLQLAAQTVWWFHPLVWWANREICRARERCCDEEVVAGLNCEPAEYAQGLFDILEMKHKLQSVFAFPGVRPVQINSKRLEEIMEPNRRFHRRTPRWCWVVILAAAVLILPGRELVLDADTVTAAQIQPVSDQAQAPAMPKETAADDGPVAARPDRPKAKEESTQTDQKGGQQDAVAALERLGARLDRDEHGNVVNVNFLSTTKATDADLVHLTKLPGITQLTLPSEVTDAGMDHLKTLTNLQRLSLGDSRQVTDAGLKHLENMTNLTYLGLNHSQVTGAGFEHLKKLTNVRNLDLYRTQFSDSGMQHLVAFTNLEYLQVARTRITDAGLEHIKGLTQVKELFLCGDKITDAGLEHLKAMRNLEYLRLADTQVTDAGLVHLENLPNLKWLRLTRTEIAGPGLLHLEKLTNLQGLRLDGTRLTDAGAKHLRGLSSLQFLHLNDTQITDAAVEHFKTLTGLRRLSLERTRVSAAALKELQGLPNLWLLSFGGPQVTGAGLGDLERLSKLGWLGLHLQDSQVTDADCAALRGLTNLTMLSLRGTQITDKGVESLKDLKNLIILDLAETKVTDAGLEHLDGLTNLFHLRVAHTQVTDAGLAHVKGLKSLGLLDLTGTQVTDAGLEHLKPLTNLINLFVEDTQVTEAGIDELRQVPRAPSARWPALIINAPAPRVQWLPTLPP